MRSDRSSASLMRRGTCVPSARSKPGSTPASSGNSRMSDRQNASIVEIAMSSSRSLSAFHAAADNCDVAGFFQTLDDALPHFRGGLPCKRDRQDLIRFDAGKKQVDVTLDEDARL